VACRPAPAGPSAPAPASTSETAPLKRVGSLRNSILFWWVLLFLVQGAERVFLIREAARQEAPTARVLGATLLTGVRADLVTASGGVALALLGAAILTGPIVLLTRSERGRRALTAFRTTFAVTSAVLATAFLLVLTIDMAYYAYNRQHLDSVFFDYVEELIATGPAAQDDGPAHDGPSHPASQAAAQTQAELGQAGKWARRVSAFALLQAVVIVGWLWTFRLAVRPALTRWATRSPRTSAAVLGLCVLAGATGLHPDGPLSIARAGIPSATYYALAQSSIWQTVDASTMTFMTRQRAPLSRVERLLPLDEAIVVTRESVAPGADFPFREYPLVRRATVAPARPTRRPNVLLIFVEALDRRFVGRVVDGIHLTPFLERWSRDTVVFDQFFSNGELTHHGLFSSLCSYFSGYGKSPIKSRYTQDFLCLPTVLRRAGYWTEMVIGYNRDYHQDHTALFLARNGIQQFLDEGNFPPTAERLGLGVTDGALFDFLGGRVADLEGAKRPFFLMTLTTSTHHPFKVPLTHPDVEALSRLRDPYLATLRYADLELERFITTLRHDGLLRNTVVLVLGDHGRHEVLGNPTDETWLAHHVTPLFVWMDPSLRGPGFRPRRVETVASHVDLAPTILTLTGVPLGVSPFLGRDVSCVIVSDCRLDNRAVLFTSHSAALVEDGRILQYGTKSGRLYETDLGLQRSRPADEREPDVADRLRRIKAFLVASTVLLDENRVWSWQELGASLR